MRSLTAALGAGMMFATTLPLAGCRADGTPSPTTGGTTGDEDGDTSTLSTATIDSDSGVDPETTTDEATTAQPTTSGGAESTTGGTDTTTSETDTTTSETDTTTSETDTTTTTGTETVGGDPGFGNCFPDVTTCLVTETCLWANVPGESSHGAVCSLQGCNDAADCPAPPEGGDPTVICEDLYAGDGVLDCLLSCALGETCPPGYHCTIYGMCMGDTEWTCDFAYYSDGLCDCGCGITEVFDCLDATADSCEYCNDAGSCNFHACPGAIDPENNEACDPLQLWTCDVAAYQDGATCDCGCGISDPDCADGTQAACDTCNGTGSCAEAEAGCDTIRDDYNAICEPPPEWTCPAGYYANGDCHCGCGAFDDFDCVDATVDSCDGCGAQGGCAAGMYDCSSIDVDTNWLCI